MNKKSISLILAMLMLAGSVISCSETTNEVEETSSTVTPEASNETVAEETEDPNARLESGLGEADYDGYTYHIFVHNTIRNDWDAEEITGEPINDAKYERITTVSDNANCNIEHIVVTADNRGGQTPLQTAVQAGANDYDLVELSAYSACNALTAGLLVDLNSIENIDLSKPWWDQYCVADCTFKGATFLATGDIGISDNVATYCIYFNKQIASNYNLPNMYDMVNGKTWTIDNYKSLAETIGEDTDNDQNHINDPDDTYGVYIWDDIMMGIVNASGIKCCIINDKGEIELSLYSEKFVDAFDKFTSYAYNKDTTCAYQRNGYDADYGLIAFQESRALFYMSNLGQATTLREMEDDFGILPLPLYEETQERYYNSAASWSLALYCMPKNSYGDEGFSRAGYITQALAYESMYTLTPAYYEQTLKSKTSRDEESSAMLDLIFATRTYDFGWYFEIGGYNEGIMNLLRSYSTDVTSMYKQTNKMAEKLLKKYNEKIAGYINQ